MGTRSIVNMKESGQDMACVYRQYDGYPSGLGKELIDFALSKDLVNGYMGDGEGQANGAGCYYALLICELKRAKIGNIYMYPIGSTDVGEEFTYTINIITHLGVEEQKNEGIYISCTSAYSEDEEGIVFQWKKTEEYPKGIFIKGNVDD